MRRVLKIALFIFVLNVFIIEASAASFNTPTKSDMTYGECLDFQESIKTSSGNGYFGNCVKATCYSGIWKTEYRLSEDIISCTNGNESKYLQIINNGCIPYIGSCTPSTNVKYCSVVTYFDCNKTSTGGGYTPPTVTTKPTTRTTTTRAPIIPTPQTTTPALKSNNNYLTNIEFDPGKINFSKMTEEYTLEIFENTTSIVVKPILEDKKAKYIVSNNTDISFDIPITITVTAENGETRVYTIKLKALTEEETLNSNSKLSSLIISGYNINFTPDIFSYSLKIKDETNLAIEAVLESSASNYEIRGNYDLKNHSKIEIIVTAEDQSQTIYLINIKKSNNISGIIVVILVVGVAGYVGYKLLRKLTSKEKETNYEYE